MDKYKLPNPLPPRNSNKWRQIPTIIKEEVGLRNILWFLLKNNLGFSYRRIGRIFKVDKATVINGISICEEYDDIYKAALINSLFLNKKFANGDFLSLPPHYRKDILNISSDDSIIKHEEEQFD